MKKKKRRISGSDAALLILAGGLASLFLTIGMRLVGQLLERENRYQSVVSLEDLAYGGDLEGELLKLPGIRSFTPVIELPARLKADEYEMETVLIGADLDRLEKQVSRSRETPLGNTPVLFLGEESLAAMTDRNGHEISEEKQKELLECSGEVRWQYCLTGEEEETESWRPCLVAGTLTVPAGEIYLPYSQAESLAAIKETKKFLLTVQGKENYERALECFGEGGEGQP